VRFLIYDQETDKAHCLNPTAAKVWNYCDGETTLADACNGLSRDLETPVDEKLVWYAVENNSNRQGSGQSISDLQNLPEDSIPDLRHRTLA